MAKHLTFKEYLDSKEQLKAALKEIPIISSTYVVNKYCKIPVGENKDNKDFIFLKPKHKIVVEWKYINVDEPDVLSIKFIAEGIDPETKSTIFWEGVRLRKWLFRNTKEEK